MKIEKDVSSQVKVDVEQYLQNPQLYKIGIDRECFSMTLFMQWIFYALWHAFVIYYVALYCLCIPEVMQPDGTAIGFWVTGMAIFGVCVLVANFELAMRFNTHTWVGTFILLVGPISYFLLYFVLSLISKSAISHIFVPTFKMVLIWIAVFFCLA